MRRCDVNQSSVWRQRGHGQTFVVEWNGLNASANGPEEPPGRRIPGILDCDSVTPFNEDLRYQVECLLSSIGNRHVFGIDVHSSGQPDVTGYGSAQCGMPSWIAITAYHFGRVEVASHEAAPSGVRKGRYVWGAGSEVKFETIRKERAYESDRNVDPLLLRTERANWMFGVGGRQLASLLHEGPGADTRYQ
jgi:hypothetical protein